MQMDHIHAILTFTRSVMGSAKPCVPRSSKNGEDEKVVAWEVRTILRLEIMYFRLHMYIRKDMVVILLISKLTCETV
jgi:hypothetical protein